MRDRLVELIKKADDEYMDICDRCDKDGYKSYPQYAEYIADHLLAVADVAPIDEIIEAVKKIICENTYPSFDHNGKPVNVWKAREGYDALDALKEKYTGEQNDG